MPLIVRGSGEESKPGEVVLQAGRLVVASSVRGGDTYLDGISASEGASKYLSRLGLCISGSQMHNSRESYHSLI